MVARATLNLSLHYQKDAENSFYIELSDTFRLKLGLTHLCRNM
jgi:hypothetical protein